MQKHRQLIEAADVVAEKINNLAGAGLAQRRLAQP